MPRSARTLDVTDHSIVAVCPADQCGWRVVGAEEVSVRRDLLLHSMTHTSDPLANYEREVHRKWFARRGVRIPSGAVA
jgi:hypothetical protein